MSNKPNLNRTINNTDSTAFLVLTIFIVTIIGLTYAELKALQYFNFIGTETTVDSFKFIYSTDVFHWINFWCKFHGGSFIYKMLFSAVAITPAIAAIIASVFTYKFAFATDGVQVVTKGSEVETDTTEGLDLALQQLHKADGYAIHDDINITKDQEVAHFATIGSTRSGKSQILLRVIFHIWNAGKKKNSKIRACAFDIKGDLVSIMHGLDGAFLYNPADKRSIYWDIALDLTNAAYCKLFAVSFIPKNPKSNNPMFENNARKIFSGLLIYLCMTKPQKWDWLDLSELMNMTAVEHKKLLLTVDHPDCKSAANTIRIDGKTGEENKTTGSVYATLESAMESINQIAAWAGHRPTGGGFSVKKWVMNPDQEDFFLILAAQADKIDTEYGPLYSVFYSMLIQAGVNPKIPQNDNRRLYVIIDELSALPRLNSLMTLVQLGGGFGLCGIFGLQDLGSIIQKYSKDIAMSFMSNINTLVACKLNDTESATYAASLFGKLRTERQNIQTNVQGTSTSFSVSDTDSLIDSDFMDLPKASLKNGFDAFLKTDSIDGPVRVKLHYPILIKDKIAESFEPATDEDEFLSVAGTQLSINKKKPSGGGSGSTQQSIKQQTKPEAKQAPDVKTEAKTTVINVAEKETKEAAKVIATNEAIDVAEDAVVEVANEVLGAPEGTTHALQLALDAFDLMADATVTKDAIAASSITTSDNTTSSKKRIRFKKKIIEHNDETEAEAE